MFPTMNKKNQFFCTVLIAGFLGFSFAFPNLNPPTLSVNISGILNCQNTTVTISATSSATNSGFSWTGPGNFTSNIANPVVSLAGVYELVVTDLDNGCTNSIQALVMATTPPTAQISAQTNVLCNGQSTGAATVMATGGAGNFSYLWSNGQTTPTLTNLSAGSYMVTVTDMEQCTAVATATITEPDAIAANLTATNESASGANDGTASANPTGGQAPYSYIWSNGQSTPSIDGLSPDNYAVTITDANNCTLIATTTVSSFDCSNVTLDFQINPVNCNGGNNGSLTALVVSNAAPITYMWSNDSTMASNSGLMAGTYSVTVQDGNGCQLTGSATIPEPPAIVLTASATDILCNGAMTGTATAMASGGTGTITYFWNNGLTTPTITDLSPGVYTINVQDQNFCSTNTNVTVTQPPALVLDVQTTDETASGANNGTATADVSGGTGTFSFLWSNGATTQMISNLVSDNYCVTITDANGCTTAGCGFVNSFGCNAIQTLVNQTNVACFGEANGAATITSFNGTEPYSYVWSNNEVGATISNLAAGTYSVTCTDATACTSVLDVVITEPGELTLAVIDFGNVACDNQDGFASVAATGGILGYTYLWSNGSNNSMITNLAAGDYSVTVTDPNLCTAENSVSIIQIPDNEPPLAAVNNINVFLNEDGLASITPEMLDAGSSDNCGIVSSSIDIADFDCSDIGSVEVVYTVVDESGLTTNISSFIMVIDSLPPVITCPANIVMEGCNIAVEYPVPTVMDNCSVGTPYFLQGVPSGGLFPAGTTMVTWGVNDGFGNPGTCTFSVTLENEFTAVGNSTQASCAGFDDGTATVEPVNGIAPYNFAWNDPNMQTSETATGLLAGDYIATITDATGCPTVATITVEQPDLITIEVIEVIPETDGSMNGAITIEANGGTGGDFSYLWYLNGDLYSTEPNLINLSAGTYAVFVKDITDCTNSDTIVVDMVLDISDNQSEENISLYPNPTTGKFYLDMEFPIEKEVSIAVFDMTGKAIFQQNQSGIIKQNFEIDLQGFSKGVYWVTVQAGSDFYRKKIFLH